ncbi:MAG: RICIN domain-containing protein [Prevotella sp.]|nr:RICIN domain-containing protein [Prevotella sp.]
MRKLLITLCVTVVSCLSVKAELKAGGEYYIWLNIYEKLLGTNEAGNGPALSAYGTKSDGYVFVAEESGESGYFLLKQKSSGKYLAASGSNSYSITLESKSTADRFRWKMTEPDCYAYLTNKKNSGSYVGIDGAKKGADYVSIYYDKRKSSHGQFSVIPVVGSSWDEARQAYCSGDYENAQGVNEVDYCQLNDKEIDRSDAVDIHITSNDNPILGSSSVNLGSDRTWLIFDNIIPSKVISTYLKYVSINGVAAKNGTNCRVAIYLNGAAVIPLPEVAMTCDGTEGEFTLAVGNHKDLSEAGQSNTMTSFTLRRGYMATLACGTNGSCYSRVFVADHADQVVTLPNALTKRVTSVNIKPWQYLSKKGWGNTSGSSGGPGLRATWYWSWSAGYSSTTDMEYVPCRQHVYWPSADEVNNKTATAAISINEPDHPEQHTKHETKPCTCPVDNNNKIIEWTTYGLNEEFQAGGGRIGSPQPQNNEDFSYLTNFFKYVDENNNHSRCDIAVSHAYLPIGGRNANDYAKYVTDTYWNLWNSVKRPIWLTELEVGATWNTNSSMITSYDKAREYLQALLQRLEESDYIERYAIYGFDYWRNKMFYDDGWITPAGEVYRDHRSTFAYNAKNIKVPNWWADGVKTPSLTYSVNSDEQTITFNVGNGNSDCTDELLLEYQPEGSSSWETLITLSDDRNKLESNSITYITKLSDLNVRGGKFRVKVVTLYDDSETSDEVAVPAIADVNAEWTVCESDIIYNGMFATVFPNANYPDGWTRTNTWGQMQKDILGAFPTAYYNQPGSLQYGNQEGHQLSLAANATYLLTFSYRSHEKESNKGITVSVLNGNVGVKDIAFPAVSSTTEWRTVSADIKTGAAGNYVLTLANSGNTWITNVSLVRLVQKGDVDGDGKMDVDDVKKLVGSLLDSTTGGVINEAADVDGNGVVDISDVTKLIEMILSTQ